MKKFLLILIILLLCGCQKAPVEEEPSFESLGYSDDDIALIEQFEDETIIDLFKEEYNEKLINLIHHNDFDISKFYNYVEYIDEFETNKLVEYINANIDMNKIKELHSDSYYLAKNEDLYLQYIDSYSSIRQCVEKVNTKAYLPFFSDISQTDMSKGYLILVNKFYALSSEYEPEDLVEIDPYYGRGVTRYEVYEQYKKLQDEANELGYDFVVCSAYRSYDYQHGLYNKYLNEENGDQAKVDTYSARPGHSEHQSGLCLDLSDAVYGMDNFGQSEASAWLNENCYKYGFIIRYTAEKEDITGYESEPWQIRYVGSSEIAKDIMDRGITFDEYYACFVE